MDVKGWPATQHKSDDIRFAEDLRAKILIGEHLPEDYRSSLCGPSLGSEDVAEALVERPGSVVLLKEAIALHDLSTVERLTIDRISRHSEGERQHFYPYDTVCKLFAEPCGPLTKLTAMYLDQPTSLCERERAIISALYRKDPARADIVAERLLSDADLRRACKDAVVSLGEDLVIQILSKGDGDGRHRTIDENVFAIKRFRDSIVGSCDVSISQLTNIFLNSGRISAFNCITEFISKPASLGGIESELSRLLKIAPNFVLESLSLLAKDCNMRSLLLGPNRTAIERFPRLILDTINRINDSFEQSVLGKIDRIEAFTLLVSKFGQDIAEKTLKAAPRLFVSASSPLTGEKIEGAIVELGLPESSRMLRERPSEFLYFCRFKAGSCDPALLRDAYTALGIENAVFSRYQERRVRDLLSRSEFRRNFTRGLEKLAQTDCIRDGSLGAAFTLDPANTLIALEALGRTDGVEKYIDKSGRIDFCSLPPCYQFMFSNYEIASTFAIRNVIALIKISQNQVKSYTYHEGRNDPALDGTGLPPRQECLYPLITFADGDEIVLSRGTDESLSRVYLPYSPVKFLSPDNLVGGKTGNQVIKGSRPLVVVASPSLCETLDVVEALKAARDAEPKPLTVLALRQPSNGLAEDLKNLGFKVGIRNEEDRKIGDYICEGKSFLDFDIVILNTRGELKNMFVEADIVIMGEDRNLAEPINSEFCPKILGFGGSWTVNQHAKIFAEETGRLTIVTSETIADALVNSLNEVASRQPDFSAAKEFRAYLEPFKRALGFQYGWVLAAAAIEFQDSLDRELAQLEKMGNEHSLACVNPDKVQ